MGSYWGVMCHILDTKVLVLCAVGQVKLTRIGGTNLAMMADPQ